MTHTDRRQFLQLIGAGALASTLNASIAKAMSIPAQVRTGTIKDVEHIVIVMQENTPFEKYFGTLRGVRGFNDPRAVKINLPTFSAPATSATSPGTITGSTQVSVFLQPQGPSGGAAFGDGLPPNLFGGPANGEWVVPPFRINPRLVGVPAAEAGNIANWSATADLGLAYFPGTGNGWSTHRAWNFGQYDQWGPIKGPLAMTYFIREDVPYYCALADAFTVGDNYFHSVMGPTNPNRYYLWSGCTGNVAPFINPDGSVNGGGVDGNGSGPKTGNGITNNADFLLWSTYPEQLQAAGISWKIYTDNAGSTFAPDFGGGGPTAFAGTFQDNIPLYFAAYKNAAPGTPLFEFGVAGAATNITGSNPDTTPAGTMPAVTDPVSVWETWAKGLFAKFKADVQNGTLPQVSWVVSPAGYSEHPAFPADYGSWYVSQVLDVLVSNPEVFSKTVMLVNYDEADGAFDHVVPPTPSLPASLAGLPAGANTGASTVSTDFEICITTTPNGPFGLAQRVPFLVISPWSKGGYVNSQVFDHSSVVQFVEQRFGVSCPNISAWRRAVCGDLTSCFNFANPNGPLPALPSTESFLPSTQELAGQGAPSGVVLNTSALQVAAAAGLPAVTVGIPAQETGVRPARALPYEMDANATVSGNIVALEFSNAGRQTVVFQVRSGDPTVLPRTYTVEPHKSLSGSWTVQLAYDLTVYGPNGWMRAFKGSVADGATLIGVQSSVDKGNFGAVTLKLTNRTQGGTSEAINAQVLDAYTGQRTPVTLKSNAESVEHFPLEQFFGWYDLVVTADGDPSFEVRLAGHVETGRDSFSDPAMGGLVKLKA
jgi:phospholipase C